MKIGTLIRMHRYYSHGELNDLWIVYDQQSADDDHYPGGYKIYNLANGECGWDSVDYLKSRYDVVWEPEV